jgi:phospholipid/cholesterol/gamma-HCH transport system substrate-binding protein
VEPDRKIDIKVGLFVGMGIVLFLATLMGLGSEQNLFEQNYVLTAEFNEIAGLRTGAAVRLAGMDVGVVTDIGFNAPHTAHEETAAASSTKVSSSPPRPGDKHISVRLRVAKRFAQRIRADTLASIQTQGVLGDQFIALSLGSQSKAEIPADGVVASVDPESMFDDVPEIKEKLLSITDQLDRALRGEDGEKATKSLADILESVRNIIAEIEEGKGIIHALVYDASVMRDVKSTIAGLDKTVASVAAITHEIQHGDGAIHSLVYDNQIKDLVASLQQTADNIDDVVMAVKEGDGVIHSLLYEDEGKNLIDNLTVASSDIRAMVDEIEQGKGTLGAFIKDPSVYEDVKSFLGGAKRNKILKSYVRDTIRKNERSEGLSEGGAVQ